MDKALRARISLRNPIHLLALGFGSGLIRFMPGTFGTMAGLPFVVLSSALGNWVVLGLAILFCVVGIYICDKTAKDMQVHDHGAIVWDEIAGIAVTFVWVPLSLHTLLLGFVLFRLFDIIKPWPIGLVDKKVTGGLGIMLDDVLAGILACACLQLILFYRLI